MERNIPRAAIHVGTDKKSFSSQVGNEAERRGWDEKRYQLKNADIDIHRRRGGRGRGIGRVRRGQVAYPR